MTAADPTEEFSMKPLLNSLENPPAGTVVKINETADGWDVRWRAPSRHPVQLLVAVFGAMGLFGAMGSFSVSFLPIAAWSDTPDQPHFAPRSFAFVIAGGFWLVFGSYCLWAGLSRRVREAISLHDATLEYDTGPGVLPMPLMILFGPIALMQPNWFGGMGGHPMHFVRKKYVVPVSELGPITLERVAERQRLTVDHGADRIEVGILLREPEREWLAAVLTEWREAKE